ncbi:hypothetical protein BpHYR1_052676 [Brachionus plicatilis]|uniref:Uncharacterized protein n=1 Tax=Brachionus plicatilis TaxID=10195 RepID=A0A3M7Q4M7_BRAPC|nr:hypothetical protein BpHYR1_052676 [Brachionus plicatilis]
MKLNYRKKSNDSKSNFYLHPYTSSISHEPPSSAQNMDQSRSRSHSNLTDINLSEVQVNSTSSSGHGHNGTLSRLARFLWKNPKKMPHSSSSQNVSNGENKEFKHLISSPGQLSHVPLIQCPKTSNFKMDAETREELRKKLSQLTTQERIQLQQKGLELLKAKINSEKDEKKNFDKTISEIKNHLTTKRQQFRSHTDIENLRNEIRNLTNEKAALELKIIQSKHFKFSTLSV